MFMEMLSAIAPFFVAGLMGTVFARFTGINMSMCVLLMFLYMGAKPVECIAAMLMFNVFTYFTVYSQLHVMKIKSFTFFPGVRLAIPILITIALAALNPFIGIVFFVFTFLMEIFAKIYKEMDAKSRPTKGKIGQMVVIAAILVTIGAAIVQFIPENYYYIVGGVTILIYAFVMWRTGDRRKGTAWWDKMLYASTFLTGLSGIDGTDWLTAMRRNPESVLSKCYPIVINGAMIIGLLASGRVKPHCTAWSTARCLPRHDVGIGARKEGLQARVADVDQGRSGGDRQRRVGRKTGGLGPGRRDREQVGGEREPWLEAFRGPGRRPSPPPPPARTEHGGRQRGHSGAGRHGVSRRAGRPTANVSTPQLRPRTTGPSTIRSRGCLVPAPPGRAAQASSSVTTRASCPSVSEAASPSRL